MTIKRKEEEIEHPAGSKDRRGRQRVQEEGRADRD